MARNVNTAVIAILELTYWLALVEDGRVPVEEGRVADVLVTHDPS